MSGVRTAALVGATGGAGTTRTTVELATTLARDGEHVAVLDAAFGTQGLAQYVDGRIDPDLTRVVAGGATLADATVSLDLAVSGNVTAVPVRAPFERLARAKSPAAARDFEELLAEAAHEFDRVLVDTPSVAANQAVAVVNTVERVVPVAPASTRGADALQRLRDRLADVGVEAGPALSVGGELAGADAVVPATDADAVADAPACLTDDAFGEAVATAAETLLDCSLDLTFEQPGLAARLREQAAEELPASLRRNPADRE